MLPVPVLAAIIGGGLGLGGTMLQNAAGAAAADKQMNFQEHSAKHQYQWAMDDMKKAGLNPMLAYKQGGAGTLSGSSYTPQNIGSSAVQGAASASSSAIAAQRQEAELANIAADTQLKTSQDKTQGALTIQAMAQAGQANANSALATMQSDLTREQLINMLPASLMAKYDAEFYRTEAGKALLQGRRLVDNLSPWKQFAK